MNSNFSLLSLQKPIQPETGVKEELSKPSDSMMVQLDHVIPPLAAVLKGYLSIDKFSSQNFGIKTSSMKMEENCSISGIEIARSLGELQRDVSQNNTQ